MSRSQDFYTIARNYNKQIWDAIYGMEALQAEWNALDYGNTLPSGTGQNDGLNSTKVGAVVFDTTNAFIAVLGTGHSTNMAKLL